MTRYRLWVRLTPYQTANTYIFADNDYEAKLNRPGNRGGQLV
jgi:hypothetical protein